MTTQNKANQPQWDSQRIQALRRHLGLTQRELADRLGTRQQTISEWEIGMYEPRGASITLLSIIAERAKSEYKASQKRPKTLPKDSEAAEPDDVDRLIGDTEVGVREVVLEVLKKVHGRVWYRIGIPGGVKEAIEKNLEKEISYLPYRRREVERAPEQKLNYTEIGNLKDIILYRPNWPSFEPFFGKHENVQRNFDDFVRIRVAYRAHPRPVDPAVWDKGRGAIRWIRKCLGL